MFSGTEDHCRCFFCGGGLRRWEEDDFPWTEHARWYPTCPFVRQCKGESFIDAVQKGRNPELDELVSIKYFYENIYISLGKYKLACLKKMVPLVEQELLTLPYHLSSPPVFSGILVTRSIVLCVMFCRSLFVLFRIFQGSLIERGKTF
jgi:hypothetical protein